jgi:hypothetical protein
MIRFMIPLSMPIIALSFRTNPPGLRSEACEDLSQYNQRNDSSIYMPLFIIRLIWAAI